MLKVTNIHFKHVKQRTRIFQKCRFSLEFSLIKKYNYLEILENIMDMLIANLYPLVKKVLSPFCI